MDSKGESITIERQLIYLTELWRLIGMEGTPTIEDIINPTTTELETILMIRRSNM